jgi:hypothetical protein
LANRGQRRFSLVVVRMSGSFSLATTAVVSDLAKEEVVF